MLPNPRLNKRFGNPNIRSFGDFQKFMDECSINPAEYKLHILQNPQMDYSGIIISDGDSVIGELSEGHCSFIQYGMKDVLHFEVDPLNRAVRFTEDHLPEDTFSEIERSYLCRALKMIGGRKFPQEGYFVFYVSDHKITFINHQKRGGFTKL